MDIEYHLGDVDFRQFYPSVVSCSLHQKDPLDQALLLPQGNLQQIHLDMALWSSGHLEMGDTLGHLKSKEDEENEFSRFRVLSPRETMA